MPKFIIRFDDISPSMAWSKFLPFDELSKELDLQFLIGVVPDCKDPKLVVEEPKENFWQIVRQWKSRGWSIAQHGFTHEYCTKKAGMLAINNNSEFSGLPLEEQYKKLISGKEILLKQYVWEPIFMAPSHSFDENTLRALSRAGFKFLTDGYGVYPYKIHDLVVVPQLFSSPISFGFGTYTICLHVNSMSEVQISNMINFIRKNRKNIISFYEALEISCRVPIVAAMAKLFSEVGLRFFRKLRKLSLMNMYSRVS